jgi:SAM-dependent methyltransferase
VTISRGETELKEAKAAEIPHEDDTFDKACAGNCVYYRPDPVAYLNDNLTGIRPEHCNYRVAFGMSLE